VLFRSLEGDVRRLLEHGDLEMGHARALLALSGPDQSHGARTVVAKGMTVRHTESMVRSMLENQAKPTQEKFIDPNITHLQNELSQKIGAKVQINHTAKGKGKVVLSYNSLDELDGILGHIK
jgi:ParB family chromosome partitioning protein